VQKLAAELGVRYFTRSGVANWNQPQPPFQRATKAGNVNAWLDHVDGLGVEYDVFRPARHRPPAGPGLSRSGARLLPQARGRLGAGAKRQREPRQLGCTRPGRAGHDLPGTFTDGLLRRHAHAVHHRLPHRLPDGRSPRDRGLPADTCRRPPRHGAARGARVQRRLRAGGDRRRCRSDRLRYLPATAVRVGLLDDPDLPAPHAAAAARLQRQAGASVPDLPELVPALVAVAGESLGSANGRAGPAEADRGRFAPALFSSTSCRCR